MRTLQERRKYYRELEGRGFSPEEIVHLMPDDELKVNANRGGILAIKEMKRREALANLRTTLDDRPLDIGV